MSTVGIRALKQNASAVVAEAAAGDIVVITDRGRPVAMLVPYQPNRIQALIDAGRATPPKRSIKDLPQPPRRKPGQRPLTEVLREMRDEERY
ncbi:MAG: type II toxin-antitoxin system prevent-host-death family antitoxin [Chloroflexota bacterium]|jgi:prevent-host-death family protein